MGQPMFDTRRYAIEAYYELIQQVAAQRGIKPQPWESLTEAQRGLWECMTQAACSSMLHHMSEMGMKVII
jgi:hypothetical protein